MGRLVILDPVAATVADAPWHAPTIDRPLRGLTIGLRLDRSWRCYETVLDVWTERLEADGARVERFTVDARVSAAGDDMRAELEQWRHRLDAAVVGLGN